MPNSLDLSKVRVLVRKRQVIWRRHALERLLERSLTRSMIFNALLAGDLIEDYSADRPIPSGLVLGWQRNHPIHVVIAIEDDETLAIITAYEPTLEYFESDFRTRRKQ
jgi:hypothetical protein